MSNRDKFQTVNDAVWGPARDCYTITPNDSQDLINDLGIYLRQLYVGTAGNVVLIAMDDSVAVTFVSVPAGTVLPVRARQVLATGTTANNIVGLG